MGKHHDYSTALKVQAVEEYLQGNKTSDAIAEEFNVSSGRMILKWTRIYQESGEKGFEDKRGKTGSSKGRPKEHFKNLEEENEYLRAKVALLEKVLDLSVKKK